MRALVGATRRSAASSSGIIGIARLFGLQTIAEGVKDEGTAAVLRELGADFAQGDRFGKAAPAAN